MGLGIFRPRVAEEDTYYLYFEAQLSCALPLQFSTLRDDLVWWGGWGVGHHMTPSNCHLFRLRLIPLVRIRGGGDN